eukprot:Opistho-2@96207
MADDDLEAMLAALTEDLNLVGTGVDPLGRCSKCSEHVLKKEDGCDALGKLWHNKCFVCDSCKTELKTVGYFDLNGLPHCEKCYVDKMCDKCSTCHKPLIDEAIKAMGMNFHPACFKCASCSKNLNGERYLEKDRAAHCETCYAKLTAPICTSCAQPIIADGKDNFCMKIGEKRYHSKCYSCASCKAAFTSEEGKGAYAFEDKLFCKDHYIEKKKTSQK